MRAKTPAVKATIILNTSVLLEYGMLLARRTEGGVNSGP